MIIRGGYNVYPREIEEVLMCHLVAKWSRLWSGYHDRLGEEISRASARHT